jgi:uncharacterized 2Fe-2S/4Fe-4S cluster protein (DUF4445 family)
MGALPGAINRITVRDAGNTEDGGAGSGNTGVGSSRISFTTIGNVPPRGLCGCGLIDAIAVMLALGALDETGSLSDEYEDGFPICDSADGGAIAIVNRDVRQYQLAKSAILSGIKLLCAAAGLNPADLDTVFIAGGLGFFIDIENAIRTALIPAEFRAKTAVCGNLSLRGAVQSLVDPGFAEKCREITAKSQILELASDPKFMEAFAENMYF